MDEHNKELNEQQLNEAAVTDVLQNPKKKISKKSLILIIVAAVLVLFITLTAVFVISEIKGSKKGENITIQIAKGSSSAAIAKLLEKNDIIDSALLFRVYCHQKGYDSSFQYGTKVIAKNTGYEEIAQTLMSDKVHIESKTVTIPEGTGIYDYVKNVNGSDVTVPGIATILEKNGVCTKADFFAALDSVEINGKVLGSINREEAYVLLEGYLFPDTYEFYYYDSKECAKLAVEKMIYTMESRFTDEMIAQADKMGMTVNEVLTVASVVQMEAGANTAQMPNVAAVFYNRLSRGEIMGSSPTCYYGDAFSFDDGRYNTYNIKGLPPGPLCSPGIDAIMASLYPSNNFSGFYYFVTDKDGKFYFHRTLTEQTATINRLKQENKWIYEYFD